MMEKLIKLSKELAKMSFTVMFVFNATKIV